MQERKAGALVPVSPPAEVFLPRRTSRVVAAAVVLAALGALGYYGYRQASFVDKPSPAAASAETAATTNSTKADDDTGPAPLVTPARAAPNPPRAARQPVESQEGKAAPAIARSQTVGAGRLGEGPSRQEACTEALAALGLCATKPEAGKAGGQEPSRAVECTAATAALGLCPPGTIQRRE